MNLFEKNESKTGILIGLAFPIIGFLVLFLFFKLLEVSGWASQDGFTPNFRLRTTALLAICVNIFPMRTFYAKRFHDSMYGVGAATILFAIVWVLVFQNEFFG